MTDDLVIYAHGLVACSVCTSLSDTAEIERRVNLENPTGISSNWKISEDTHFASGQTNPCPCERYPKTHKHYLLTC